MFITEIMKELGIGFQDVNAPESLTDPEDIIIYGEEQEAYEVK